MGRQLLARRLGALEPAEEVALLLDMFLRSDVKAVFGLLSGNNLAVELFCTLLECVCTRISSQSEFEVMQAVLHRLLAEFERPLIDNAVFRPALKRLEAGQKALEARLRFLVETNLVIIKTLTIN